MPHWLVATAGAAGGTLGALLLLVGMVVAATVVLGVASVALSADRRTHALDVMDRFLQLVEILRGRRH